MTTPQYKREKSLANDGLQGFSYVYTEGYNSQRTVFRYAQKTCGKDFFGEKLFFF